jgi:hypothetical protein
MTDDELRQLIAIAQSSTSGQICLWPAPMAEIAADALRFRHVARHYDHNDYRRLVDATMTP